MTELRRNRSKTATSAGVALLLLVVSHLPAAAVEADLVRRLLSRMRKTDDPALAWPQVVALTKAHDVATP
jgi:hypothetical protein